jgi:hypothetical protein
MNTIEENKVAVNYVELEGDNLLELLEGVASTRVRIRTCLPLTRFSRE